MEEKVKTFFEGRCACQSEPEQSFFRFLSKSDLRFSLYIMSIVLVQKRKEKNVIPRIIDIKKLISDSLKLVWTCIRHLTIHYVAVKKGRRFYLRPFSHFLRLDSNQKITQMYIYWIIKKKLNVFNNRYARDVLIINNEHKYKCMPILWHRLKISKIAFKKIMFSAFLLRDF